MNEKDIEFLLKTIASGMRVLSTRLMLIGTLLLTFSLFAYAMWVGDPMHLAIASAFAVFVFLPVRALDSKGVGNASEDNKG